MRGGKGGSCEGRPRCGYDPPLLHLNTLRKVWCEGGPIEDDC